MTEPYWEDKEAGIALYLGDMREILPALDLQADLIVADPPYAETSLAWDRWPDGWPALAATAASSMWCFGSMRMFLQQRDEFADWKLSQDVIWEKHNGSGFAADRFKRVHEIATHWYKGDWRHTHHDPQRERGNPTKRTGVAIRATTPHTGKIAPNQYVDDGTRLVRSVLKVRSMHHGAIHPTEKPLGISRPSRFGNPFTIKDAIEAEWSQPHRACAENYGEWLRVGTAGGWFEETYRIGTQVFDRRRVLDELHLLRGKDLACTCPLPEPGQPDHCHASVLLALANTPTEN